MTDEFGSKPAFARLMSVRQSTRFGMFVFGTIYSVYFITSDTLHFVGLVTIQDALKLGFVH